MSKKKESISPNEYFETLDHPLKSVIGELRKIIPAVDAQIEEHIKWNSLSYYYSGPMNDFDPKEYKRDIVVLNIHKKDQVLLVFPTGARIIDDSGLLEGKFTDGRKTAKFTSDLELKTRQDDLSNAIKNWIETVDR